MIMTTEPKRPGRPRGSTSSDLTANMSCKISPEAAAALAAIAVERFAGNKSRALDALIKLAHAEGSRHTAE